MKINTAQAVVLLIVIVALIVAVQVFVNTIDVTIMPSWWTYVKAFFSVGAMTVAITFLVNISGFIENTVGSNTEVKYEAKQFAETFARYAVYMTTFSAMILAVTNGTPIQPYASEIAAGVSLVVDVVKRTLDKISTSNAALTKAITC